jgi:hypothetical protein
VRAALITGEIGRLTLDDPTDVWSSGTIVVGHQNVLIPRNLRVRRERYREGRPLQPSLAPAASRPSPPTAPRVPTTWTLGSKLLPAREHVSEVVRAAVEVIAACLGRQLPGCRLNCCLRFDHTASPLLLAP